MLDQTVLQQIEKDARNQTDSQNYLWHIYHVARITASLAHLLASRRPATPHDWHVSQVIENA